MHIFSRIIGSAAIGLVVSLPLTFACSSGRAGSGPSGVPAPASSAATNQTAQPLVPRQFTEVAAADWTIDTPLVGRELECQNGKVRIFDCQGVNLLSYLPESAVGGEDLTGIWGWTDPATGREFVLAGHKNGTAFVEITDPVNPRYLGGLPIPTGAQPSHTRDIKVYRNHAYIVSDGAGPHGMQVFDLTQLRTVTAVPAVFKETVHYDRIASAHTIAIDTAAGFAYAVRPNGQGETCGGGLHMIDIRTPTTPTFVGCYPETLGGAKQSGSIHETQCVVYHGPDQQYRGRQLCMNAAEEALGIVDVTDKQQPKSIGVGRYPNVRFTHQGWLTDDHRYFFLGDEFDEGEGRMTRTIVFDLKELKDPIVVKEFFGTTQATDHNLYIRGRYVYQSNYRAGLRVLDIRDPANPKEIGYFDTTPMQITKKGLSGSWANYPYFKQNGLVAVSSFTPPYNRMNDPAEPPYKTTKGLFIVRFLPATATR